MIILYISEEKAQLVGATASKGNIKIKFTRELPTGNDAVAAVSAMFADVKKSERKNVHIIVDSPEVKYREVSLPCINEYDLRKIIEKQGVQSGKAVLNTADELIAVMDRKVNKGVDTHGHLNIIPATIMLNIERILKACNISAISITIAERAMDIFIAKYGKGLYSDHSILINYKDTFAESAIYSYNNNLTHDKYRCEVGEKGALLPIVNLSHRAAVVAAEDYNLHIEKIYLVGTFDNTMQLLDDITEEVGIDTEVLPMPKEIKFITLSDFRHYIHAIAGIAYNSGK